MNRERDLEHTAVFDSILGQDKAISRLRQIIDKNALPGAMLFTGPDGVGKCLASVSLAMTVNCKFFLENSGEGCGVCNSCSRIKSGNHPDVMMIRPDGNFVKIGQIRDLIEKISIRPKEASIRFVIIDGASNMTLEASNALLKSLEEPPQKTCFILISSSMLSVLPTIRSRCCNIGFSPLSRETVEKILSKLHGYGSEISTPAAAMSDGSVKAAISAIEKGWAERRRWLYQEIASLRNKSLQAVLALAEEISAKSDDVRTSLEITKICFRDLAVFRHSPDSVYGKDLIPLLERTSSFYEDRDLVAILERVHEAQRSIELNAVSRLVLETLFLKIAGFIK